MKKLICIIYAILINFAIYSQTSSQQNTVARIDYLGYSNGNHVFKLSNTQSCQVTMQYDVVSTNKKTNTTILGNNFITITVTGAQLTAETVKLKATQFCAGVRNDLSWIQATSTGALLPIKFGKISATRVTNNTIKLIFESEEDNTIKQYNILVSVDGKTFKRVTVLFPNGIIGHKSYSTLIKL